MLHGSSVGGPMRYKFLNIGQIITNWRIEFNDKGNWKSVGMVYLGYRLKPGDYRKFREQTDY